MLDLLRTFVRRRGQPLPRELFLVDGAVVVRTAGGTRRITAKDTRGESLNSVAGDAAEISTATAVDMIGVDLAAVRHLLEGAPRASTPVVSAVDPWMLALLEGPVMRWFPPAVWARLLRSGQPRNVRQGELVLARGEVAACVFVVGEGVAASATTQFGPGDFFAEESALTKCPATVDVVMTTDGVLVSFPPRDILDLANAYDAPVADPPQRLDLDQVAGTGNDDLLAGLVPQTPVALRGGDAGRRLVVAAELMRRGFAVV